MSAGTALLRPTDRVLVRVCLVWSGGAVWLDRDRALLVRPLASLASDFPSFLNRPDFPSLDKSDFPLSLSDNSHLIRGLGCPFSRDSLYRALRSLAIPHIPFLVYLVIPLAWERGCREVLNRC